MRLSPEHIQIGVDKELWLFTNRKKTDISVKIPVLPAAMEIITKYRNDPKALIQNRLFPNISNQKLDLPAKLTTLRRFILTTLRRCNLTTHF